MPHAVPLPADTAPEALKPIAPAPGSYAGTQAASLSDREAFWLRQAEAIDWHVAPTRALDSSSAPLFRWFPDATLNVCENAVDRHVRSGHGARAAIIWDSGMTGEKEVITYADLSGKVERAAGALAARGVGYGDRVAIMIPMLPEALIAMLACARLGAVHSVVFGGFAAKELAARIDDAEPVLVVTASGGIEPARRMPYLPIVDAALRLAKSKSVQSVLVKHREGFEDVSTVSGIAVEDWDAALAAAAPHAPVPVLSTDPLYILYTSGTTGRPKGVVRDCGGYAVALAWTMRHLYNIRGGEVMWTASDVGWVVGHSYIVYAPLLAGATTVMYEGKPVGTPDAGAFWRVCADHGVNMLFTAPTALRAIRTKDPHGTLVHKYDLSALRTLFMAGERLDPDTYAWAADLLRVPVVDHWWQTETGWAICGNPQGIPSPMRVKPGSAALPMPGYDLRVIASDGADVQQGEEGLIVARLPLPPGTLTTLWRDDARFVAGYLAAVPGHYLTGDTGYVDAEGYVFVLGRSDDVINTAGHRLSAGALEVAVAGHAAVAECAVVGVKCDLKGQVPLGFVVLKSGAEVDAAALQAELVARVRAEVGAFASPSRVVVVDALPKTRSGKILRKTMRQIVDGERPDVPGTIEDVGVLESFAAVVA